MTPDRAGDPDAGAATGPPRRSPRPGQQCNANQFSQPFTAPDGTLYVVWANFNNAVTAGDNRNQILLAKSTDGGNTFSAPVKVTDYYDLPDCVTYTGQDAGRQCVPTSATTPRSSGPRTTRRASSTRRTPGTSPSPSARTSTRTPRSPTAASPAGINPDTGANLYDGVLTPGACNNDIIVSVSTTRGATFTGTTTDPRAMTSVTQARRQRTTDQWFQWADYTRDGRLAVSYYDRQYGDDELTGCNGLLALRLAEPDVASATVRVTSSSMPAATQFGGAVLGRLHRPAAYSGHGAPLVVGHPDAGALHLPGHGDDDLAARPVHRRRAERAERPGGDDRAAGRAGPLTWAAPAATTAP